MLNILHNYECSCSCIFYIHIWLDSTFWFRGVGCRFRSWQFTSFIDNQIFECFVTCLKRFIVLSPTIFHVTLNYSIDSFVQDIIISVTESLLHFTPTLLCNIWLAWDLSAAHTSSTTSECALHCLLWWRARALHQEHSKGGTQHCTEHRQRRRVYWEPSERPWTKL